MYIKEIIEQLTKIYNDCGNLPLYINTCCEDDEGEEHNVNFEIDCVGGMFDNYAFIGMGDEIDCE